MIKKSKQIFLLTALMAWVGVPTIVQADSSNSNCCGSVPLECGANCNQSQNLWQPHAFSVSMSRELLIEKFAWSCSDNVEGWHGTFGVGFEYMKSLGVNGPKQCGEAACCKSLGAMPFWSTNQSNLMTVGDNSGTYNVDAYQFGLGPVTTNGSILLNPVVYQTGGDFLLYAGAHQTERGFFVKVHGPVGVININPRLSQAGDLASVNYPIGSLTRDAETEAPYENMIQAFAGGESAGDLRSMKFGLINCNCTSAVKFGDLAVAVGYNFYADEKKHIGAAVRFTAPTGNKANGVKVLQPIFGRNGHWAAGGEIIGHIRAYQCEEDDRYVDFWFDGTAEHLFQSQHMRSFDLAGNGLGSKYLLLANYANGVYQNEITNAINVTTVPVQSIFSVEGNFALMFDYHHGNWNFGIGYEGWGRTAEQLNVNCNCAPSYNLSNYAVIGRQQAYSQDTEAEPLFLCQPTATISKSANYATEANETEGIVSATVSTNRISADDALDINGQRARAAYTSKPFVQIGYTCKDSDYTPYLALSGAAEISNRNNTAVSFWTVGLQGGLVF